ncbi:MAG: hypothetical protein ACR2PT_12650 [Endozoicomonas sp.]
MEPGNGVNKNSVVAGGDHTGQPPVSKKEPPAGKFAGTGKPRAVKVHPSVSQVREHSGTQPGDKSIRQWEIEIAEVSRYLDTTLNELNSPGFSDRNLKQETGRILTHLQAIQARYNQRIQGLAKAGRQEEAIAAAEMLSGVQRQIEAIQSLQGNLSGFLVRNKPQIRQQIAEHLVNVRAHLDGVRIRMESEKVFTPQATPAASPDSPPKPATFTGTPEQLVEEATTKFNIRELQEPYCWLRLGKNPRKTRDRLGSFFVHETARFDKLKPLLELATGWHALLARQNQALEPNPDIQKCYQALKFLHSKESLFKSGELDTPEERQAVIEAMAEAEKHLLHLDRFDRDHSEMLDSMLTTLPATRTGRKRHCHLFQLFSRGKLPPAGRKYTSGTRLAHALPPLNDILIKHDKNQLAEDLYTDFAKVSAEALASPEAFAELSSSVDNAEELEALAELYTSWVKNQRSEDLDRLIDAYHVARLDLGYQDVDELLETLDDLRTLKPDAGRLAKQTLAQRREVCIKVISDHLRTELKALGFIDRIKGTVMDQGPRNEIIDRFNKQLGSLASIQWDETKNEAVIQIHHVTSDDMTEASMADFDRSLDDFLEGQTELAGQVSMALVQKRLARHMGDRVHLVTELSPAHVDLKVHLANSMASFHRGMAALQSRKELIERYIILQEQQQGLTQRVQEEFNKLDKKLAKRRPLKRKTRKKLFQISKQAAATDISLGKASTQLEHQQRELLTMIRAGKLKVSQAKPVLHALHMQLAHSHCWYPAGKSKYEYKETEALSLAPIEAALKKTTKPFPWLRKVYSATFKPEMNKLLKEARLILDTGSTATASPRLLIKEYTRLKDSLEKIAGKDKKLQMLANSLNDYIQDIEEQWPVPTPGAAAA